MKSKSSTVSTSESIGGTQEALGPDALEQSTERTAGSTVSTHSLLGEWDTRPELMDEVVRLFPSSPDRWAGRMRGRPHETMR